MTINTHVAMPGQGHFEEDCDDRHFLFPTKSGLGVSHIVDITTEPHFFVSADFPCGTYAVFLISPDRINWVRWKLHGKEVVLSSEHPIQRISTPGHYRVELVSCETGGTYDGVEQPSIRWYPATISHESEWALVPEGDSMQGQSHHMNCDPVGNLIAALASATAQQRAVICELLACIPTPFITQPLQGTTPPTVAPLMGQSIFYLQTVSGQPDSVWVWNGLGWVLATGFDTLVTALVGATGGGAQGPQGVPGAQGPQGVPGGGIGGGIGPQGPQGAQGSPGGASSFIASTAFTEVSAPAGALTPDGFGGWERDIAIALSPGVYVINWSTAWEATLSNPGFLWKSLDVRTPLLSGTSIESNIVSSGSSHGYFTNAGVVGITESGSGIIRIDTAITSLKLYLYLVSNSSQAAAIPSSAAIILPIKIEAIQL